MDNNEAPIGHTESLYIDDLFADAPHGYATQIRQEIVLYVNGDAYNQGHRWGCVRRPTAQGTKLRRAPKFLESLYS